MSNKFRGLSEVQIEHRRMAYIKSLTRNIIGLGFDEHCVFVSELTQKHSDSIELFVTNDIPIKISEFMIDDGNVEFEVEGFTFTYLPNISSDVLGTEYYRAVDPPVDIIDKWFLNNKPVRVVETPAIEEVEEAEEVIEVVNKVVNKVVSEAVSNINETKELHMSNQMPKSVTITTEPVKSTKMNTAMKVGVGIVIGVGLAVAAYVVKEYLDNKDA